MMLFQHKYPTEEDVLQGRSFKSEPVRFDVFKTVLTTSGVIIPCFYHKMAFWKDNLGNFLKSGFGQV